MNTRNDIDAKIQPHDAIDSLLGHQYKSQQPMMTLFRLVGLPWWQLIGLYLLFLLKNAPIWWLPFASAVMVDAIAQPDAMGTIIVFGGIALLTLAINIPGHVWYMRHVSYISRRIEQRLRSGLIRRLQHLTMSFHNEQRTGALQTKVVRDVEQVEQLINQLSQMGIQSITMLGFAIFFAFADEPIMAGLFVIMAPLVGGLLWWFRRPIKENNHKFRKELEQSTTRINDMLTMMPVTRAHAVEEQEIANSDQRLTSLRLRGQRLDIVNALFQSSTWVSMQFVQLTCLVITIILAVLGTLSIGQVILYQFLFNYIIMAVTSILNMYPALAKGFESIRSLGEVLECPDLEENEGKTALRRINGSIRFEHAQFSYNGRDNLALNDVNLDIQPGNCVAVVGASGSGKSTLMSVLIGFQRLQEGELYCDGVPASELDFRSWRRGLAVVSQQVVLFSGTLRDNICYGVENVNEADIAKAIEIANLSEMIAELPLGLQTEVGENGVQLSGGQRQRIAIARAVIRDPQVIILDEATSALDVHSERLVQEAIDRLIVGRTTIIIAHRLSTIRQADWIVVMDSGRIIEQGKRDTLEESQGAFSSLLALQRA